MKKNSHRNGIQAFLHNRGCQLRKTLPSVYNVKSNVNLFKDLTLAQGRVAQELVNLHYTPPPPNPP